MDLHAVGEIDSCFTEQTGVEWVVHFEFKAGEYAVVTATVFVYNLDLVAVIKRSGLHHALLFG